MGNWKAEQLGLAASLLESQLASCRFGFGPQIAAVDGEAEKHGRFGSSGWQLERVKIGQAELRKRAQLVRSNWRRVLDSQSTRRAKKLRETAAENAESRFRLEAHDVAACALWKGGHRYPPMNPNTLDEVIDQITAEIRADLLLPATAPEKSWFERQIEDFGSKVLVAAVAFFGGLLMPWIRAFLRLILER